MAFTNSSSPASSIWDAVFATNKRYVDLMLETNKAILDSSRNFNPLEMSRRMVNIVTDTNRAVMTTWMRRPNVSEQFNGEDEQIVPIGEEVLTVGVRKVVGAATRVNRVIKQVPVEQSVRLHDETITIERRPATEKTAGSDAVSEREYVMIDTREIPVISKDVKVREELVLRRTVSDRVETVRETVRVSDVQVDQPQRMPVVAAPRNEHRDNKQQQTH